MLLMLLTVALYFRIIFFLRNTNGTYGMLLCRYTRSFVSFPRKHARLFEASQGFSTEESTPYVQQERARSTRGTMTAVAWDSNAWIRGVHMPRAAR